MECHPPPSPGERFLVSSRKGNQREILSVWRSPLWSEMLFLHFTSKGRPQILKISHWHPFLAGCIWILNNGWIRGPHAIRTLHVIPNTQEKMVENFIIARHITLNGFQPNYELDSKTFLEVEHWEDDRKLNYRSAVANVDTHHFLQAY